MRTLLPPSHQGANSAVWTPGASGLASHLDFHLPDETPAEQFSNWLPYSAYVPDERVFVNRESLGFMLEIMPQSGADERMAEVLISLYASCPPETGIQFQLFGSPHIRSQLRQYDNLRIEDEDQAQKALAWGKPVPNTNLYRKLSRQRVNHLLRGTQSSLTSGFHYTLRDFRLMMSVAFPGHGRDMTKREALLATTDFLARSFTWPAPVLATLRGLGIGAVGALSPVKRLVAHSMMFGWR